MMELAETGFLMNIHKKNDEIMGGGEGEKQKG